MQRAGEVVVKLFRGVLVAGTTVLFVGDGPVTLDSRGGVFLVAGLAEGNWHVAHDGAAPVTVRVSAEEKALWFEGPPGRYPLTR